MKTIVKASEPRQFLPIVPRLFGFTPTRSAVVIPFSAGRSAGGMRVDLPAGDDIDSLAATLIGTVCRVPDADGYVLVVYADEPATPEGVPHAALAAALASRAHACGLRTVDALYVGGGRWASYVTAGVGGDVAEFDDGPATAAGATPEGDQTAGATLPELDLAASERTALALRELSCAMQSVTGPKENATRIHPLALAATERLEDVPLFFEELLDRARTRPDDDPAADAVGEGTYSRAALIWCLERPALRDIGLLTWIGGLEAGDDAVDAQLRWEEGGAYTHDLASCLWGDGPRPDVDRLEAALQACRNAAAAAPRERRPGPLAACAWLSWALGRSTHADAYGRSALEIDPAHGLAGIVISIVQAGHLPDWAFRP